MPKGKSYGAGKATAMGKANTPQKTNPANTGIKAKRVKTVQGLRAAPTGTVKLGKPRVRKNTPTGPNPGAVMGAKVTSADKPKPKRKRK